MPGEKFLTIRQARYKLADSQVFEGIDLNINKGENWALIGPGGCGKTTLLQLIAGNLALNGGEIFYHFFDKEKAAHTADATFTAKKMIAMVASKHHFKNLSNTADFYYQQRYNAADSENAPVVSSYLKAIVSSHLQHQYWTYNHTINRLSLDTLLDKQLIKLSNGETKRLLLAASLLKSPALLLLDNPLVGLDAASRQDFNLLVSEMIKSGITIMMATAATEIPESITNVAVMQNGSIVTTMAREAFRPPENDPRSQSLDLGILQNLLGKNSISRYHIILNMKNVGVKYGEKQILKNINWQILPGERWALLGHNGAGKSTLLSLVNGDNPQAYANDIILFDRKRGSGESIWDIKKNIGFVSPELHQYFPSDSSCLQAAESGFYDTIGLFRPSQPAKAAVALKWMQILGISDQARMMLKNTTASVQRLCLLARALVKNPPLLILDEPCQGLDSRQQLHFKNIITEVCRHSNVSLVYVTHYPGELPELVTKVLQLENGRQVAHQVD